jgi:hypothetical protein
MWYDPKEDFKDEDITGTDKTNIETIVALETSCTTRSATSRSLVPY